MTIRTIAATAALVLGLAATAATPSVAASGTHAANSTARQYESLVQTRDAAPTVVEQHQGRTINAWGHTFTVE